MRVDILSKDDAARVRACIRSPDVRLIWDIGTSTGLRISDILALKACQLTKKDAYVREKKTKKLRRIYIRKPIREEVEKRIASKRCREFDKLFGLSRSQAWRSVKDAARRAEVKTNVGTHTMRKTYVKAYAQKNGLGELQVRLNHDKMSDTIGYITSNADLGLDEKGYKKKRRKKK